MTGVKRVRRVGLVAAAMGLLLLPVGVAAGAVEAPSAPAGAVSLAAATGDSLDYTLTIAARQCPAYGDIMANRARNNIQESLRDLGKDTVYSGGEPVVPDIEEPNDPLCTPLNGWKFQLGDGYTGPKIDNLSTVTSPGRITDSTATVPLLDEQGQPTGQSIAGATTLTLTPEELARAQSGQNLWVQGGTANDPLLYSTPVNSRKAYGFGALRCALDNLNGDNVEWVSYPAGARHVFCYYYTVGRAPTPGTIVVRKQVNAGTDTHTFQFNGDVSYVPDGDFSLSVVNGQRAETSFVRAAGDTWSFRELDDQQYEPTGPPVCTSSLDTSSFDITDQSVQVVLGDGDLATCTYTNQRLPTGPLRLDKVTTGGIGTFPFTITRPDNTVRQETVTTRRAGESVLVADAPSGPSGTWKVAETLPPGRGGTWKLNRVTCNGSDIPFDAASSSASLDVAVGVQLGCTAENLFTPAGAITIRKNTVGGFGAFSYVVRDVTPPQGSNGNVGEQTATTTDRANPATATGDPLTGLQIYTPLPAGGQTEGHLYEIVELAPAATPAGSWQPTSASCGRARSVFLGNTALDVTLTPDQPAVTCDFVNTFIPAATISLTKVIAGDPAGRTGPVQVDLLCGNEPAQTLVGPVGQPGPFQLPGQPISLQPQPPTNTLTCSVNEVATGVAPGATVSTNIDVTVAGRPPVQTPGEKLVLTLDPGDNVNVVVTDDYAIPPTTPPTTTAPPTTPPPEPTTSTITSAPPPTGGGADPGSLPSTGTPFIPQALGLAFTLMGAGTALTLWASRRRQSQTPPSSGSK